MPTVIHRGIVYNASSITSPIVSSIQPVYPLSQSVVGIRLRDVAGTYSYLCNLHIHHIQMGIEHEPLTLQRAYHEAAMCMICHAYLAIPDGYEEWDKLRDKLCHNDYSEVEIYTEISEERATYTAFNALRLRPGCNAPDELGYDHSAKHVADKRRDEWHSAIYVDNEAFNREIEKRTTCYQCGTHEQIGYVQHYKLWSCVDCLPGE